MFVGATHERGDEKLEMWQYKVVDFNSKYRGENVEDILNSLGQQGWELVAVIGGYEFHPTAYLKRETHASA